MNALPQHSDSRELDHQTAPASHLRRDAPHHATAGSPVDPVVGPCASPESELVDHQARQLGEYLQQRQRALDRRESQIYASTARIDSDLRLARMWWLHHRRDLEEREQELRRREDSLNVTMTHVAAAEIAAERHAEKVDLQLDHRETNLDARQADLALAQQALTQDRQIAASQHLSDQVDSLKRQQQALATALKMAGQQTDRLESEQRQLADERNNFRRTRESQQAELNRREQRINRRVRRIAQRLWERLRRLHRARAKTAQFRERALSLRRESLGIRIAAEQLNQPQPDDRLRDSHQGLRQQMDTDYRALDSALSERRAAINKLAAHVVRQRAGFHAQREQIEQWIEAQRRDLAASNARLAAWERLLDQREQSQQQAHREWQLDCHQQQRQINQLLATLAPTHDGPPAVDGPSD